MNPSQITSHWAFESQSLKPILTVFGAFCPAIAKIQLILNAHGHIEWRFHGVTPWVDMQAVPQESKIVLGHFDAFKEAYSQYGTHAQKTIEGAHAFHVLMHEYFEHQPEKIHLLMQYSRLMKLPQLMVSQSMDFNLSYSQYEKGATESMKDHFVKYGEKAIEFDFGRKALHTLLPLLWMGKADPAYCTQAQYLQSCLEDAQLQLTIDPPESSIILPSNAFPAKIKRL